MTASVLSPFAQPFRPIMGEIVQPMIYNNGVPSLTFIGSEHEFLAGITDEVLDEAFPPTAEEAAELEATEFFVDLMATLAVMEEKEEAARSLHAGLKKRWEARRGLHGKPLVPRHSVNQVHHGEPRLLNAHDLVVLDRTAFQIENRMRAKEHGMVTKPKNHRSFASAFGHKKPIQQPRKNS